MPYIGGLCNSNRQQRAKEIHARLLARGLHPRSLGYSRAFFKAMRR